LVAFLGPFFNRITRVFFAAQHHVYINNKQHSRKRKCIIECIPETQRKGLETQRAQRVPVRIHQAVSFSTLSMCDQTCCRITYFTIMILSMICSCGALAIVTAKFVNWSMDMTSKIVSWFFIYLFGVAALIAICLVTMGCLTGNCSCDDCDCCNCRKQGETV
jgi:hypothetical protein